MDLIATITKLASLADKATVGPWIANDNPKKWVASESLRTEEDNAVWPLNRTNDADFVIAARNELPELCKKLLPLLHLLKTNGYE